jgi:hypothetical protein
MKSLSKVVVAPALAAVLVASSAQAFCLGWGTKGNGNVVTEPRVVPAFSRVVLEAPLDVSIHPGKAVGVVLSLDSNLAPLIHTEVKGGALVVRTKGSFSCIGKEAKLDITLPEFTGIEIEGSGDARIAGFTRADQDVVLHVDGSGDVKFSGSARTVEARIQGSGDVRLEGNAQALKGELDGSGRLQAKGFPVHYAKLELNGSGGADLTVNEGKVDIAVSGSGDVEWQGTAHPGSIEVAGSGGVRHRS